MKTTYQTYHVVQVYIHKTGQWCDHSQESSREAAFYMAKYLNANTGTGDYRSVVRGISTTEEEVVVLK